MYDSLEISDESGQPVELYLFQFSSEVWRYTSSIRDYEYELDNFAAVPLARTAISKTAELPKMNIQVTAPYDFEVAELWRVAPPSDVVSLSIMQLHHSDSELQAITKWRGRVINAEWRGAEVVLECESIYTSLKRFGLRRAYQRGCPHVLYGPACRVINTTFLVEAVLTLADGVAVSSPTFLLSPDGYFDGGYIEWEPTFGVFHRRAIRAHVGDSLEMTHPVPELASGMTVSVFPGCPHNMQACDEKFNNLVNYGGFSFIPRQNPFGGNSIA